MKKVWKPLLSGLLLSFSTGCEKINDIPVSDYYLMSRTSDQIRQDELYQTLFKLSDLSSRSQDNIALATGCLGVALGDSPETGIPALIFASSRADDDNTALQKQIVLALGDTQSDLAIPTLSEVLLTTGDRSADGNDLTDSGVILTSPIRATAAQSLGLTFSKAAVPPLIEALQDSELNVRQAAHISLQTLANFDNQYNPHDSFEDRAVAQSQWASWWQDNRNKPRTDWLLDGFQRKGLNLTDFHSPENLHTLVQALEKGEHFLQINASHTLANFQLIDSDHLDEVNATLIDLLDHNLNSVKESALVALIKHNHLSDVRISETGQFDFSKSLDYNPEKNLDAAIAFVKNWWHNRNQGKAE